MSIKNMMRCGFLLLCALASHLTAQHQRAEADTSDGADARSIPALIRHATFGTFRDSGNKFSGNKGRAFIIQKSEGPGVIRGFNAAEGDLLRLQGFGLTKPAQVRALMRQDGSAVVLGLPSGPIRILNAKIDDIPEASFQLELDREGLTQTFSEDFDVLDWDSQNQGPNSKPGGRWRTNYGWGPPTAEASRSLNAEEQVYTDPAFKGTRDTPFEVNPFQLNNGILEIRGDKAPKEMLPFIWGRKYTSGLITTKGSFSQLYGVFEIRARVPKGRGFFPAFWLLPADSSWPPEIDVFEVLGHTPDRLYTTYHSKQTGEHTSITFDIEGPDLSADFHVFTLEWQKDELRWYRDGIEVARTPTPSDMHKPMYMLANLAVGASWPGSPDAFTSFPGIYAIDWIRAYRRTHSSPKS